MGRRYYQLILRRWTRWLTRRTHFKCIKDLRGEPERHVFREIGPLCRRLEHIPEIDTDRVELDLLDQDVSRMSIPQTDDVAHHRGRGDGPRETGSTG